MWDTNYTFYKIDLVRFVIDILATAVSYKSLGGLSSVPGSSAVPTDSNTATSSTSSQPPSASTGQLLVQILTSSHYIAWRPHAGCGVVRIGPVCGWMWKATKPGFCTGQVFVFVFVLLVHMLLYFFQLSRPVWLVAWSLGIHLLHLSLRCFNTYHFPSIRQRLSCGDCLEDKREDYQNCSVLYCVTQLCTIICTLMWAVITHELF